MERASGAVLGEGGSEVNLRRLFTLNKTIAPYLVTLSAKRRTCVLPSRRPFFPDANWLIAGLARILKRPHGEAGHRYRARNCIGPSLRSG
jgi:hypothetical protein